MKWPWVKKSSTIQTKIRVIGIPATKLTLSDWQKDVALVKAAQTVLSGDYVKLMVQVLQNSHPGSMVLPKNFPIELRSAHQSQCEGYTMALANLEAMGTLKEIADLGEPTFEREEFSKPDNE